MPTDIAGNILAAQQQVPRYSNLLANRSALEGQKISNALGREQVSSQQISNSLRQEEWSDERKQRVFQIGATMGEAALQNPQILPQLQSELIRMGEPEDKVGLLSNPGALQAFVQASQAGSRGSQGQRRIQSTQVDREGNTWAVYSDGTTENLNIPQQQFAGRIATIPLGDGREMTIAFDPATQTWKPLAGQAQSQQAGQPMPQQPNKPIQPTPQMGVSRAPEDQAAATARAQAEVEQQVQAPQNEAERQARLRAANIQQSNLRQNIESAKSRVSNFSTGFIGQAMSNVGGTESRALEAALRPIRANLAFDRLQQMRDESQTGGALGQVSERELALLESAMTGLDQFTNKEQVVDALNRIQAHYDNWKLMQFYNGTDEITEDWYPQGYIYYDEDENMFYRFNGGNRRDQNNWAKQ